MPPVVPHYDMTYLVFAGIAMLLSHFVGAMLKHKFTKYSQIPLSLSGRDVAQRMLRDNGIGDVQVTSVPGQLTDHYHPAHKTVNLSEPVFASRSVAAAAVAAHECGHAVQHATRYPMLALRSGLVPVVNLGSQLAPWVIIVGIGLATAGQSLFVLWLGVALFSASTLFALVTLPVEFDASRRALAWIERSGATAGLTHNQAKDVLFWTAMTYTVAALASIGQLLYYVMLLMNVSRRD